VPPIGAEERQIPLPGTWALFPFDFIKGNWRFDLDGGYTVPEIGSDTRRRIEAMKSNRLCAMRICGVGLFALLLTALPSVAPAQGPGDDLKALLDLTPSEIRAKTADIVGGSMNFSEEEGKAFWPLYREYENELGALTDRMIAVIKDYQANVKALSDTKAKELAEKVLDIGEQKAGLDRKYYGKFVKVLPAARVFQFFQLFRRIDILVNLRIAMMLPMIGEDW
jgi:hypothetical protein